MEIRQAFITLSQRRLPPMADLRVAMLFSSLRPAIDAYLERMKSIQSRMADAEMLPEDAPERAGLFKELNAELLELGDYTFDAPAPLRRLKEEDLPKEYKSKDGSGESNSAGRALIAMSLMPEFFEMKDPDASTFEARDDDDIEVSPE